MAREIGCGTDGNYSDMLENIKYYINALGNVFICIDEAGDLDYPASGKITPKMSGYLCPKTLFRESNFEKYINEVHQVKQTPKLYEQYFKSINKIQQSATDHDATISDIYG